VAKIEKKLRIISQLDDAIIAWKCIIIILDVIIKTQHQHLKSEGIKVARTL
jgi:hypothetical protein